MRIDSCQADCAVPWLSDVLIMLTAALHMCQQLKDKVSLLYSFTCVTTFEGKGSTSICLTVSIAVICFIINFFVVLLRKVVNVLNY